MARTLYICYFGVRQPLVQTQVIPYLLEIMKSDTLRLVEPEDEDSKPDHPVRPPRPSGTPPQTGGELSPPLLKPGGELKVSLLTFEPDFHEKWTPEQIEAEKKKLAQMGIEWHCLPYHKRFSAVATAYDIFRGAWFIRGEIREKKIDILHGRVHVPTLMGALARKFSKRKPKLLFDIRGFFPEEYTDAGIWPENGWLYRSAKRVERWLMKEADGFVVLTEKARDILFPESKDTGFDKFGRPVEVIPCCVDFQNRFSGDRDLQRDETRRKLGVENRFVFTHVGALGGLYLTEEIADFLATARSQDSKTFGLFLTQSDPNLIIPLLRERNFRDGDYFVGQVDPKEIPGYLSASDVGMSFVKAGYATQSRSPTKIPEYLACGLPVISNRGVGDIEDLIDEDQVGVLVDEFTEEGYFLALDRISSLGNVGERCHAIARAKFDLESVGGKRYRKIYKRLY